MTSVSYLESPVATKQFLFLITFYEASILKTDKNHSSHFPLIK